MNKEILTGDVPRNGRGVQQRSATECSAQTRLTSWQQGTVSNRINKYNDQSSILKIDL